jgi:hypothetical protein
MELKMGVLKGVRTAVSMAEMMAEWLVDVLENLWVVLKVDRLGYSWVVQ